MLGNEALPQHPERMPLRATARRAGQVGKQRLRFDVLEDGSEFSDDGWGLLGLRPSGSLDVGHWKIHPSYWLRGRPARKCRAALLMYL